MKKKLLILVLCLPLSGCATFSEWSTNPNTGAALNALLNGALAFTAGNEIGAAVDGVQGAAALLRSLQSTPKAASPVATAKVTALGGAAPIAGLVANAVQAQVASGKTPDVANEVVAKVLDKVTK